MKLEQTMWTQAKRLAAENIQKRIIDAWKEFDRQAATGERLAVRHMAKLATIACTEEVPEADAIMPVEWKYA